MIKFLAILALAPSYIAASTHTYIEYIPYMSIEYGPGTVLTPGTSITTKPCYIVELQLDANGVFTIRCDTE